MDMDDRGDDAIRLVVSFPKKMNLCMKGYADKYLYLLKPGMEIHRIPMPPEDIEEAMADAE